MNDTRDVATAELCLRLPESAHMKLKRVRDHLAMFSYVSYATTKAEEEQLLQIRRSMLGLMFEIAEVQLDDVLQAVDGANSLRSVGIEELCEENAA